MQLVHLTRHLKPITLAVGLSITNYHALSELNASSRILTTASDKVTSEHIKSVDLNDSGFIINRLKFKNHLKNWKKKTLLMSSAYSIIENEDFKAIVSMGKSAVPFIVEELEFEPSILVWALNFIYNRKITDNPNTTITEASKLWVKALKS